MARGLTAITGAIGITHFRKTVGQLSRWVLTFATELPARRRGTEWPPHFLQSESGETPFTAVPGTRQATTLPPLSKPIRRVGCPTRRSGTDVA
jgi:hypothetical protein